MNSVFVLLFMAVCAQGAQYIFPPRVHPDHPDECHYKGPPELFIKLTETVQMPEGCGRLICTEKQFIFAHTCGVVAVPNGCRNVPDLSKPYPECCIDIVCDQNEITAEDEDY